MTKCKDILALLRQSMTSSKETMLLNVKRNGLSMGFTLRSNKMSGLSIDYQESSAAREIAQVVDLVDGVVSGRVPQSAGIVGPILEGIASITSGPSPKSSQPTIVNLKSPSIKMDLLLRERRVTGLSVDYQKVTNASDISDLLGVLNKICSGGGRIVQPREVLAPEMEESRFVFKGDFPAIETNPYSDLITGAVQKSLGIVGEQGKEVLFGLLERRYGMRLQDVPSHPRAFSYILREAVGAATSQAVEKEIVSEIKKSVQVEGESLKEVVHSLKGLNAAQYIPSEATPVVSLEAPKVVEVEKSEVVESPQLELAKPVEVPVEAAPEATGELSEDLEEVPTVNMSFNVPARRAEAEEIAMKTAQEIVSKESQVLVAKQKPSKRFFFSFSKN